MPRIETDLSSLLPQQESVSALELQAQHKVSQHLNRDMLVLISHADKATELATRVYQLWQHSGMFAELKGAQTPNVQALQKALIPLQVAVPSTRQWQALIDHPEDAFLQQAQALVNPFLGQGLLPVEQDWLGLGRLVVHNAQPTNTVFWDMQNGWLSIQDGEKTWLLLNARLPEQAGFINVPNGLLPLIATTQQLVDEAGGEILITGGAIFAAENKASGEAESRYMSMIGLVLTFTLLLSIFRSPRIFALCIPLTCGVLSGLAATIIVFEHIHILTLVVGTSLLGVLVDFPLHWLASGIVQTPWQRWQALKLASKAFLLSLLITLIGYLALLVTPMSILQQTAVFSSAALLGAFLATLLLMPFCFVNWSIKPQTKRLEALWKIALWVQQGKQFLRQKPWSIALLLLLILVAGLRLNTQDDIRQWAHLSPNWLQQAQLISALTQVEPSGQYFLLAAEDEEALFARLNRLNDELIKAQEAGHISQFQSINQWLVSPAEQQQRRHQLIRLSAQEQSWQVLSQLGIDSATVKAYLVALSQLPIVSIEESLKTEFAAAWQDLYLGSQRQADGRQQVAAIVTVNGVKDSQSMRDLAKQQDSVLFVDQRGDLNRLFKQTRDLAVVLKILSYALAIVVLARVFTWRQSAVLLFVPIMASLLTVTLFSLFGWNLSLFAVFGLFLVTAIGMDYAIYAAMSQITIGERLAGVTFAALTTMLSFGILGFSETPAIAGFGRSVAIGVFFCLLMAIALLPITMNKEEQEC